MQLNASSGQSAQAAVQVAQGTERQLQTVDNAYSAIEVIVGEIAQVADKAERVAVSMTVQLAQLLTAKMRFWRR